MPVIALDRPAVRVASVLAIVASVAGGCGQHGGGKTGGATSDVGGTAASGTDEPTISSSAGESEDDSDGTGVAVPEIVCSEGGARTWCFEVTPTDRRPTFMPDFDGDGLADMVGWTYSNIYVAFNDGSARFDDEWIYEIVPDPFAPTHLLGDPVSGWRLLTGPRGSGDFEIRELPPGGGGRLLQALPSQMPGTSVALAADLVGDGYADGIITLTNLGSIEIFPDAGRGMFEPGFTVVLPNDVADNMIVPGDLDGDGHADIVVDFGSGLMAYFGDGAYGFPDEAVEPDINLSHSIVAADFEGDGRAEVFTLEQPRAAVLRAEGHAWLPAAFEPFVPAAAPFGNWRGSVADLDGDGIQEGIAFVEGLAEDGERRIRRLHVFSGYADGAFADQAIVDLNDACPGSVATKVRFFAPGDLDGDGASDLHVSFAYKCSPEAESEERYRASLLKRDP